jgi:hypothetical protein
VVAVLEARAKVDAERASRNSMAAVNVRNKVRLCPRACRLAWYTSASQCDSDESGAQRCQSDAVHRVLQGANFQNAFKDVAAMPEGGKLDADGADPFARRKTVSRNYWSTRQKAAGAAEDRPSALISIA